MRFPPRLPGGAMWFRALVRQSLVSLSWRDCDMENFPTRISKHSLKARCCYHHCSLHLSCGTESISPGRCRLQQRQTTFRLSALPHQRPVRSPMALQRHLRHVIRLHRLTRQRSHTWKFCPRAIRIRTTPPQWRGFNTAETPITQSRV
jgi:hypothetical protein